MKILIFCDYYLPGFRAGGPIASISREVARASSHEIFVTTRDHDLGSREKFPIAKANAWVTVGNARVNYVNDDSLTGHFRRLYNLKEIKPDIYYFNSIFSFYSTLLPLFLLKIKFLSEATVVIAPRGETLKGALAHRSRKKRMLSPWIRKLIPKKVIWHVSTDLEKQEHIQWLANGFNSSTIFVTRINLAQSPTSKILSNSLKEHQDVVFVSRIDRKKGLKRAIEIVSKLGNEKIRLFVYGAISDEGYYRECLREAEFLKLQGRFEYRGEYEPNQVLEIFESADLFLFPTEGENFGHVIAEALSVGCPVIALPTTPWSPILNNGGGGTFTDDHDGVMKIQEILDRGKSAKLDAHEAYASWYAINQPEGAVFDHVLEMTMDWDKS